MPFQRNWDESCPRVWDKFLAKGQEFVIQDLDPKDDEEALDILVEHLCKDELLCSLSKLTEDEKSVEGVRKFWKSSMAQRMCLGLYTWREGKNSLVGVNVCVVISARKTYPNVEITGEKWKNVYKGLLYLGIKQDPHKYLELDLLLHAFGLVVKREYRGYKLGAKILAAREPLCRSLGIQGTTTVFSVPASQKSAASCGFETIHETSLKDLADSGLDYPPEPNTIIKLMVKRFN